MDTALVDMPGAVRRPDYRLGVTSRGITLWYAAYGSNLNRHRFARHLGLDVDDAAFPFDRWLVGTGQLRFGGTSQRWVGGVAFLDPFAGGTVIYRLYKLTFDQFLRVWESENSCDLPDAAPRLRKLLLAGVPGETTTATTDGKYETVAWIDHDDGLPVITITSVNEITPRPPGDRYLNTIELGLADGPLADPLRRHYVERLRTAGQPT